ncbi:MAG: type II toxin-antitoxin system RelE/ParE family toxin [Alphaproteobacteria bacterium]
MRIVWSPTAVRDLQHVRDCIAERNPRAATAVSRKILKAVQALSELPSTGRPGRLPDTRELVIPGTPFIVPYTVRRGRVEIIAVLHGAQRWPE